MQKDNAILSRGVQFMLLATLCFGIVNAMVKGLSGIPALEVVWFRAVFMLGLSYIAIRKQRVSVWGNNKLILFLRGLFGTLGVTLFFMSLQRMELASAIVIHYLAPIFTTLVAIVFLKEKIKGIQWLFFLISFSGVIVVKGFGQIETIDFIIGVGSAFFSGFAYNAVRKLKGTENPNVIIFYFGLVALPLMSVYYLIYPGQWVAPKAFDWLLLTGIGVFTQVAQYAMTKAYHLEPANRVAGVSYSGILIAILFGSVLFDESLTIMVLGGIILVLSGVLLNLRSTRKI